MLGSQFPSSVTHFLHEGSKIHAEHCEPFRRAQRKLVQEVRRHTILHPNSISKDRVTAHFLATSHYLIRSLQDPACEFSFDQPKRKPIEQKYLIIQT